MHIIGRADPLRNRSEALLECYAGFRNGTEAEKAMDECNNEVVEGTRTVLYHNEGHQIPSIRTGLYPRIKRWLDSQSHY